MYRLTQRPRVVLLFEKNKHERGVQLAREAGIVAKTNARGDKSSHFKIIIGRDLFSISNCLATIKQMANKWMCWGETKNLGWRAGSKHQLGRSPLPPFHYLF
jgi:hypothetical protein